jgi:DNA-binding MarR family transcriptional regulator
MSLFPLKNLPRYECLQKAAEEYPDLDPSACEAFLYLLRAGDRAFQMSAAHFAKHRISPGGFMVLMLLLNRPHCEGGGFRSTPAELAEFAGVTRATMTGLVDTLEREKLVKRQADIDDRRMMTVHVTARGRKVMRGVLPGHFQRMASLMAPLAPIERNTLVRLLAKLIAEPSTAMPPAARPQRRSA